jgi:uncharacterized protein (DUF2141 family)
MVVQLVKPFFFAASLLVLASSSFAQTGRITVQVEGIKSKTGKIALLLFNQAQGFPGEVKQSLRQELKNVNKEELTFVLDQLPYSTYAISVIHDENENQRIDTNFLGIPKEGYGFSNNSRNLFRAPRFKEAAFALDRSELTLRINLIY